MEVDFKPTCRVASTKVPPVIVGPIFSRELAIAPRRPRFFLSRSVYAAVLVVLMCTAWLVLAGAQVIRSVGDMARFGMILFQVLAPLQVAWVLFFSAMSSASSVAQEKDRKTLVLLLMTQMTNSELVFGKLFASLLNVWVMVVTAVPVFMLTIFFGGVSPVQVVKLLLLTLASSLMAGSLGVMIAYWREKTFQSLAMTALALCFWMAFWQVVTLGALGTSWWGVSTSAWGAAMNPLDAVRLAARPVVHLSSGNENAVWTNYGDIIPYLSVCLALTAFLNLVAIFRVRIWNPSRDVRLASRGPENADSIRGRDHDRPDHNDPLRESRAEVARAGHVDSQLRSQTERQPSREVWDNPVLWREMRTWAYGKRIVWIRISYLILILAAASGLHWLMNEPTRFGSERQTVATATTAILAPLLLLSLVMVNALSVTSVTTERDGRCLDLLLATDMSPQEFIFGKLFGVLYVAGFMVVAPAVLTAYLWWGEVITGEDLLFIVLGWAVMNLFACMLGLHCGMHYANSRLAIAISMGTIFFLFLGVVTCVLMMISFSGSFNVQLAPFLAFILGGGVGLYVALGARNPSAAILLASVMVPFATFYAITSFMLQHNLAVFLVTVSAYGFTTAAMMVPALYEFDFSMGRTTVAEE